MRHIQALLLVVVAWLVFAFPVEAQNNFVTPGGSEVDGKVEMCLNGSNQAVPCGNATTPIQVAGTFSATLSGFAPGGTFASLTATNASASVALPGGTAVLFQNTGTTVVSCTLGVGSATATANEIQIPASSSVAVTVGSNTFGACIDQTGSASNVVVLAGGSGLFTGFGGGGGGGSGGVVTQPTASLLNATVQPTAPGSTNLATWTSVSGTQNIDIPLSGNFQSTLITLDNTAVTGGVVTIRGLKPNGSYETIGIAQVVNKSQFFNLTNPYTLPNGGATGALAQDFLVGNQGYSAINVQLSTAITGAGTLVVSYRLLPYSPLEWALLNPLVGGTAILGKLGIDQTTPGTTNGVAIAQDSGTVTGATPTVAGTTASNLVAKASAGNLQNLYVDSSAAGWVFVINATSLPANATLTIGTASGNLQDCFELPKANTEWVGSMNYNPGPWSHYSVGITVAISNTSCPVLTAASTGKFLHAQAN